jgi:glycine hydroxymethyltransferase
VHYRVRRDDGRLDEAEMERLAHAHRPRLIIAGGSAYPRAIDFARFRTVADAVGARLLVDMAHFAGLVAAGVHPDPLPHADVVTTTTYKSLRGARGGLILCNDPELARRIDAATFPGLQGSPILHAVAAKAVCLGEALRPEFKAYARNVLDNAHALADSLAEGGLKVVTGGTDTPLVLVDLGPKGLTGDVASAALERAGLTANKNAVPFDPEPPGVTSGLRFGASAGTVRGFGTAEFRDIGAMIVTVLNRLAGTGDAAAEAAVLDRVRGLCLRFPIYPD